MKFQSRGLVMLVPTIKCKSWKILSELELISDTQFKIILYFLIPIDGHAYSINWSVWCCWQTQIFNHIRPLFHYYLLGPQRVRASCDVTNSTTKLDVEARIPAARSAETENTAFWVFLFFAFL